MRLAQKRVIQALQRASEEHPELRIGQLIENARLSGGYNAADLFYLQDEHLARAIEHYRKAAR